MQGSIFFLSTVALVVAKEELDDPAVGYISLGLLPVVAAFFAYIAHRRLSAFDPKRVLKSKDIIEELGSKYLTPTDVDLAARYCIESEKNIEMTLLGVRIYEDGLKRFPKSIFLHARCAIYLVFVVKSRLEEVLNHALYPQRSNKTVNSVVISERDVKEAQANLNKTMRQIKAIIRRTFRLRPEIDLHYCFFYLITRLEQEQSAEEAGENKLYLLDSIRYKHDLRSAITHHRRANEAIASFWRAAHQEETENQWQQSKLADIYFSQCTSAEWYYNRLMMQVRLSSLLPK
jgi:hypothetical protein